VTKGNEKKKCQIEKVKSERQWWREEKQRWRKGTGLKVSLPRFVVRCCNDDDDDASTTEKDRAWLKFLCALFSPSIGGSSRVNERGVTMTATAPQ